MDRGTFRTHAVALVALAVLLRALIPVGWMPGGAAGLLIPCDGHAGHAGHVTASANAAGGHSGHVDRHAHAGEGHAALAQHDAPPKQPDRDQSGHGSGDGLCPFAATAFAAPAPVVVLATPVRIVLATVAIAQHAAVERRAAFAGSPRGPPRPV